MQQGLQRDSFSDITGSIQQSFRAGQFYGPECDIRNTLEYLHAGTKAFEICAIGLSQAKSHAWQGYAGGNKAIIAGWFIDKDVAVQAILKLESTGLAGGIYTSLNPCDPSLTGRCNHHLKVSVPRTKDDEIISIENMLIDVDPSRKSGISSSSEEHELALEQAHRIYDFLTSLGWPEPLFGSSGNGTHLIYKLPGLPNTPENVELIRKCLLALGKRFSTDFVKVDEKVFNPARLTKIYGTMTRKGDSIWERPHRQAKIISYPFKIEPVTIECLQALADEVTEEKHAIIPVPAQIASALRFDVKAFLEDHGLKVVGSKTHGTATFYLLEKCLFDDSHSTKEAAIGQTAEGKLFYHCFHDSCKGRTWHDAKKIIVGDSVDPARKDPAPAVPTPLRKIESFTVRELMREKIPEIRWVIHDLLPEGFTVLGGNPKIGKSWLALNMGLATASGGKILGKIDVAKATVLYLALEDGKRRLQKRIRSCCSCGGGDTDRLHFVTECPRMDAGGLGYLEKMLKKNPDIHLVIIDTLARFWANGDKKTSGRTLYHLDYDCIAGIKSLADKYRVAILGIHHLRKSKRDNEDPIELLSGSMGISGAADTILILSRHRTKDEATLLVTGRDVEKENSYALIFDRRIAAWQLLGTTDEIAKTKERQQILDAFDGGELLKPSQVAARTKMRDDSVRKLIRKLFDEGKLEQVAYGVYKKITFFGHTDHSEHSSHNGHTVHSFESSASGDSIGSSLAQEESQNYVEQPFIVTAPDDDGHSCNTLKRFEKGATVTTVNSVPKHSHISDANQSVEATYSDEKSPQKIVLLEKIESMLMNDSSEGALAGDMILLPSSLTN